MAIVNGGPGNDTLTGTTDPDIVNGFDGDDLILVQQGGDDVVSGGEGADRFFFGDQFTDSDIVDGGNGFDSVFLRGVYNITLAANSFFSVERLYLLSDPAGSTFDYRITTVDANVAAGATLIIDGVELEVGEELIVNGSAETDGFLILGGGNSNDILSGGAQADQIAGLAGNDRLFGLAGNDDLTGGQGADRMNGGAGNDRFIYAGPSESSSIFFDTIVNFQTQFDTIDLVTVVTGWTGNITTGSLSVATFDADLAAAVDGALAANSAVLFRPDSGSFAGRLFAVIDADGDGSYTAGNDYVIEFENPVGPPLDSSVAIFV